MLEKMFKNLSFGKQTQKGSVPVHNIKHDMLPNQISSKILDLQIQMERDDFPQSMVQQLLQAYTEAVQFYQEKNNQKYKLYQKRMKDFLKKPVICSMIKGENNIAPIKRQEAHKEEVFKAEYRIKEEANKIITNTTQKAQKQQQRINRSIQQQELSFKNRIQGRKIKTNNNSVTSDNEVNEQNSKKQKVEINLILGQLQTRVNVRKVLI